MFYESVSTDKKTIERYFVTNQHRLAIWEQFTEFVLTINREVIPVAQIWMDGSFVTQKPYPNDMDLVIYVPKSYLDKQFARLNRMNEPSNRLDVKWVPVYEELDSIRKAINELEEMKWFLLFNSSRSGLRKILIDN